VNSLWPRTVIATAAVLYELGGEEMMSGARKPEILPRGGRRLSRNMREDRETAREALFGQSDVPAASTNPRERGPRRAVCGKEPEPMG
jgi:hypothetical protein